MSEEEKYRDPIRDRLFKENEELRKELAKKDKAIREYQRLADSLDCECDGYFGFTCGIHKHRRTARAALSPSEPPRQEK